MASICCSPPESVPATCFSALLEARKELKDVVERTGDLAGGAGEAAHFQIFAHGHLLEHAPALGAERHAQRNHLAGRHADDVLAVKGHLAGARLEQAGDGVERGGLARAVGADEGDDLALVDLEGDALDGVYVAVVDVHVLNFEQAHWASSFLRPRYASMTVGFFWISSAVPLAMTRP